MTTITVHGSKLYNYMIQDPMADWFQLDLDQSNYSWEENLSTIPQQTPQQTESITISPNTSYQAYIDTLEAISLKIPIIHGAVLWHKLSNTVSKVGALVLSTQLNEFLKQDVQYDSLAQSAHYVAVVNHSIKLELNKKGKIKEDNLSIRAYKANAYCFKRALDAIQVLNQSGVVLMRGMNLVAKIDFSGADSAIIPLTLSAISWVRDVTLEGKHWNPLLSSTPIRAEMLPNLANKREDGKAYSKYRLEIARHLKELTLCKGIGSVIRQKAHDKGVYCYDDSAFNAIRKA